MANKFNSRAVAAQLLAKVILNGTHIETLLSDISHDKPFIQELSFGVLRYFSQLEFVAKKLLKKPFREQDTDIYMLVLVGLYQLMYLDTAEFAAVNECVTAAKQLKKVWAASLLNAVLRNFLRNKDELVKSIETNQVAKYAHPVWLIEQIKQAWPKQWQTILDANNQHPPLTLRVNQQKISREDYLEKCRSAYAEQADKFIATQFSTDGIVLTKPQNIKNLPGFADGEFSVQDEAAQFAVSLLELKPGLTVLDCCAAPGGKTCHILETEPKLAHVVALDNNAQRVERIHENLQRLNLTADVIVGDAEKPETWWNKKPFDRILLDAPCSAIGVIRRHPEIKTLRQLSDVTNLAGVQLKLLTTLWPLLKPEGILLYATCSILPQENDAVIEQFLKIHPNAKIIPINTDWGVTGKYGRYCLPPATDGFYYAKLTRLRI